MFYEYLLSVLSVLCSNGSTKESWTVRVSYNTLEIVDGYGKWTHWVDEFACNSFYLDRLKRDEEAYTADFFPSYSLLSITYKP